MRDRAGDDPVLQGDLYRQPFAGPYRQAELSAQRIAEKEHGYTALLRADAHLLLEDADYVDLYFICSGGQKPAPPPAESGLLRFFSQLSLDPLQKLGVRRGLPQAGQEKFRRLSGIQRIKHSPKLVDTLEFLVGEQQFLVSSS